MFPNEHFLSLPSLQLSCDKPDDDTSPGGENKQFCLTAVEGLHEYDRSTYQHYQNVPALFRVSNHLMTTSVLTISPAQLNRPYSSPPPPPHPPACTHVYSFGSRATIRPRGQHLRRLPDHAAHIRRPHSQLPQQLHRWHHLFDKNGPDSQERPIKHFRATNQASTSDQSSI